MLRTRLLVSAVLIPAFIGLCWLDAAIGASAPLLFPLALLLSVQASREMCTLLRLPGKSWLLTAGGCCALLAALWAMHWMPAGPQEPAWRTLVALGAVALTFALSLLAILLVRAVAYAEPGGHTARVASETFIVAYVGVLLACAAELRWTGGGSFGYLALGSLVIGAKVGDIGGYTFGRLFGRRKLAPHLSPGKTRAGGVGAVLTAAVAVAAWLHWVGPLFVPEARIASWPWLLLFGAVLGIAGLIGDLCESLIKRDVGMKDASNLMPAFGGLLDLIDSILYIAPLTLLVWTCVPPVS